MSRFILKGLCPQQIALCVTVKQRFFLEPYPDYYNSNGFVLQQNMAIKQVLITQAPPYGKKIRRNAS